MKKIANKIALVALTSALVVALVAFIVFRTSNSRLQEKNIEMMSNTMYGDFDRLIKSEVETMVSMLRNINMLADNGDITHEQAKDMAIKVLREVRYGESGYFWADDSKGNNVVLLGKDAEGKNRMDLLDKKGNSFIRDIVTAGMSGGGFTDYWFPKAGGAEALPKRGYSMYFEPFDMVVGTGNYIDDIDEIIMQIKEENDKTIRKTIVITFSILSVLLLLVGIGAFYSGKLLSNPIVNIVEKIKCVANGDLTVEVKSESKDEVGLLAESMDSMVMKLRNVVDGILQGSTNIAAASGQLSSTSQSLSQGASEQASSVEEVSATMEEIGANIEQNTENAQQTEKISQEASDGIAEVAVRSKSTAEANREIAEKINIINDIAFQTNILALNAAVEAARAGEHGKGFAVVAAEVRKLAERSKIAADEIVGLTTKSLELAEGAGELMDKTTDKVENTTKLVQEIAAASIEQNNGTGQVNAAIQQLNSVTQQNAAASEEIATSAEELTSQADQLKDEISFFNTGQSAGAYSSTKTKIAEKKNTMVEPKDKPYGYMGKSTGLNIDLSSKSGSDSEFESF